MAPRILHERRGQSRACKYRYTTASDTLGISIHSWIIDLLGTTTAAGPHLRHCADPGSPSPTPHLHPTPSQCPLPTTTPRPIQASFRHLLNCTTPSPPTASFTASSLAISVPLSSQLCPLNSLPWPKKPFPQRSLTTLMTPIEICPV